MRIKTGRMGIKRKIKIKMMISKGQESNRGKNRKKKKQSFLSLGR